MENELRRPIPRLKVVGALLGIVLCSCQSSEQQPAEDPVPPPMPTNANASVIVKAVRTLPPWATTRYSAGDVRTLLGVAKAHRQASPKDMREALAYLCHPDQKPGVLLADMSRVYVFLRALFEIPERVDRRQVRFFGGWVIPAVADEDTSIDVLWPLRKKQDRIVAVEPCVGYFGAPYDGAGEYDHFRATIPLRR